MIVGDLARWVVGGSLLTSTISEEEAMGNAGAFLFLCSGLVAVISSSSDKSMTTTMGREIGGEDTQCCGLVAVISSSSDESMTTTMGREIGGDVVAEIAFHHRQMIQRPP